MNISLIAALTNHNVYYVKDNTISYYLSVPKITNTHITIEIKKNLDRYDFSKNDTLWVKENVIAYYKEIDNISNCFILPMFNEQMLNIMGDTNINNYVYAEKIITYLINSVYTLLTNNKINPFKEIILVKNDQFLTFINYFKAKYGSRIICTTLLELLQSSNVKLGDYKKIETENMNFVVGNNNEQQLQVQVDKNDIKDMEKESINNNYYKEPEPSPASGGYVAYYLLGFVSILVTLFILYLVI